MLVFHYSDFWQKE